jgi:hypothetical protein
MAELRPVTAPPVLQMKEFFQRARWSRLVLLTYSFDLPFFEAYLLPALVQGGARSIAIAADATWLQARLPAWLAAGEVREAGRSYTLSGVRVPGAFHPKVLLAADETAGAVLVGSGNISAWGMATGGELFSLVEWREGEVPSLARETWRFCRDAARLLSVDDLFAARVDALAGLVPALAVPTIDNTLLHNLTEPLIEQFVRRLAGREVTSLLAWSPFTDRRLAALAALVERLRPARITLAFQPGLTGIDGEHLAALAAQHPGVDWRFVELDTSFRDVPGGRDTGAARQLVHAKGLLITVSSGEEFLLTGSPNLSAPALLRTASEANVEVGVLARGRDLRSRLFDPDGPVSLGEVVGADTLTWAADPDDDLVVGSAPAVELLAATWDGTTLALQIRRAFPSDPEVLIDQQRRLPLVAAAGSVHASPPPGEIPTHATLIWSGGRSGPVVVADLGRLEGLARSGGAARHTPLEALDYGGDSDLLALLEELARLAILSSHDIARLLRGQAAPSETEEAAEATGKVAPVDLGSIDFEAIRQHPRGSAYGTRADRAFDAPRLELWLDDVVRQFDALREQQRLRLVRPEPIADDEMADEDTAVHAEPQRRWPVSRRVRVRVHHRVRRYIDGIADPRFRRLVTPDWMAQNYALFLDFLRRLWDRAADPATAILESAALRQLARDLLVNFWGSDERAGYWAALNEEERLTVGVLLEERHSVALTIAIATRLLDAPGAEGRDAPFIVGGFVAAAAELGLLTTVAAADALVYLDRTELNPAVILQRLRMTTAHFTWERFCTLLSRRHGLRQARLEAGLFTRGEALVIDAATAIDAHPRPLAVLADWIAAATQRGDKRDVFQMLWGTREDTLIYERDTRKLTWRQPSTIGRRQVITLAIDVTEESFATWAGLVPPVAVTEQRVG